MKTHSVSIKKIAGYYSADVRPILNGIAAPCGGCKQFKWIGDALIFITETTGKDIPTEWPLDCDDLSETI